MVTVDGAKATFAAGAADLPLAQPLHVGQNALSLHVDRPGMGRDEVVALSVPVAYRVRADVSAMSGPHPSILIHVEALAGSRRARRRQGRDARRERRRHVRHRRVRRHRGPGRRVARSSRSTCRTRSRAPGTPRRRARSARASPSRRSASTRPARARSSTTTRSSSRDARPRARRSPSTAAAATVGADGTFEKIVALAAPGENLDRSPQRHRGAGAPHGARGASSASRAWPTRRRRSRSSRRSATTRPSPTSRPTPASPSSSTARSSSRGRRGTARSCSSTTGAAARKAPCLARVVVGQELALARGDRLRAYGRVARGFATPAGQTVPGDRSRLRPSRRSDDRAAGVAGAALGRGAGRSAGVRACAIAAARSRSTRRGRARSWSASPAGARTDRLDAARTGSRGPRCPTSGLHVEWRAVARRALRQRPARRRARHDLRR